jgi:hypothetical protein
MEHPTLKGTMHPAAHCDRAVFPTDLAAAHMSGWRCFEDVARCVAGTSARVGGETVNQKRNASNSTDGVSRVESAPPSASESIPGQRCEQIVPRPQDPARGSASEALRQVSTASGLKTL